MKYKEEFWAIPKSILADKRLCMEEKFLYAILWTRMNGENLAWPGQDSLADTLNVSKRSVVRYIKNLEKVGLIEKERVGLNRTNRYSLKCQIVTSGSDTDGTSRSDTALSLPSIEKNRVKEQSVATDVAGADWSSDDLNSYLNEMVDSSNPAVRIIAMYLAWKGVGVSAGNIQLRNKEQAQSEIRRHLRAAGALRSYNQSQLEQAFEDFATNARGFDWKLETVGKYINYDRRKRCELLAKIK